MALVVVDALRADTFFGDAFASFRAEHPAAAAGVVRTSPVSMSTAGVRSMATGTFPDLFDVLHNWDNVASGVPAVPALARAAGRKTAIFGDSIWRELFPDDFVIAETEAKIPRIIYYLRAETLVDDTFVRRLAEHLKKEAPPDFLVLHLVGLDHAGHRHGVTSAKYADVARRVAAPHRTRRRPASRGHDRRCSPRITAPPTRAVTAAGPRRRRPRRCSPSAPASRPARA